MNIKSRKGIIPFQWILAIIIGALVIGLFYSISVRHGNVKKKEINVEVGIKLSNFLSEIKSVDETYRQVEVSILGKTPLKTKCMAVDTKYRYSSSIEGVSFGLMGVIPFIPKEIRGPKTIVYSTPLKLPFYVGNAIAILGENEKIYDTLNLGFPEEMKINSLPSINSPYLNIICINVSTSHSACDDIIEVYNNKVKIDGKYYDYLGNEMLKLAIISRENYPCGIELLNERIQYLVKILKKRTEEINQSFGLLEYDCKEIYTEFRNLLENINGVADLSQNYDKLEQLSRDAYIKGCPSLY